MGGIFGGGTTTVQNQLDPTTTRFNKDLYKHAAAVGNQTYQGYRGPGPAGADPMTLQALQQLGPNGTIAQGYGQAAGGIGLGMDAINKGLGMQWNPQTMQQYMSPYTSGVIDQNARLFGDLRQGTLNDINAQATQAQAFGGSRHGVAEGQALADLGKTQAYQNAGLLQDAYGQGMGQFNADRTNQMVGGQQLSNLGFGGLQGLQGLADARMQGGDYLRNVQNQQNQFQQNQFLDQRGWAAQQLAAMASAGKGQPYGSTQTQSTSGNPFGQLLGAGLAIGGTLLGGPAGGLIGGSVSRAPQLGMNGYGVGLGGF